MKTISTAAAARNGLAPVRRKAGLSRRDRLADLAIRLAPAAARSAEAGFLATSRRRVALAGRLWMEVIRLAD